MKRPYMATDAELLEWMLSQGRRSGTCLLWPFGTFYTGYGCIRYTGSQVGVHRLTWALVHNIDVFTMDSYANVLHSCDVKLCFEPTHLHLGDASQNALEAFERGQRTAPIGMLNAMARLTPENVAYIRSRRYIDKSADLADQFDITASYVRTLWANCTKVRRIDAVREALRP